MSAPDERSPARLPQAPGPVDVHRLIESCAPCPRLGGRWRYSAMSGRICEEISRG